MLISPLRLLVLFAVLLIAKPVLAGEQQASRGGQANLLDFGAACDGATDIAPAFERALSSLPYGGTIRLPAGLCSTSRTLTVSKDNLSVEGAGLGATVVIPVAGVTQLFDVHPPLGSKNQIVFPSFRFFSVDGSKAKGLVAFRFRAARYVFIDHLFTTNCFTSYLADRSLPGESPFTSTFHLSEFQIDNTPDDPNARAILLNGAGDDWMITNGRIFQNSQSQKNVGMELRSGAGFMIQNVDISSMGRALLVDPREGEVVRFGQITALQCDTSWGDAALLDGTEAFASGYPNGIYNLVFVNCWFSSAGVNGGQGNGLNIRAAKGITVEASQVFSNSLNGILIGRGSEDINILNNQISGNSNGYGNKNATRGKYSGVAVDDGAQSFAISGNRIGQQVFYDNSQMFGIQIGREADNYQVTGNHLSRNLKGPIFENEKPSGGKSRIVSNLPDGTAPK